MQKNVTKKQIKPHSEQMNYYVLSAKANCLALQPMDWTISIPVTTSTMYHVGLCTASVNYRQ